jgi:hypothetical protein
VPAGAVIIPPGAAGTGATSGGSADDAAAGPAAPIPPPAANPDSGTADVDAATINKTEAPAVSTRMQGFLAALAAAAYGFWHWRRAKAMTERKLNPAMRGTVRS